MNVVNRLTRVVILSTFAGLKVLGLTYVLYVLGLQLIVVREIISQVRIKKHNQAINFNQDY